MSLTPHEIEILQEVYAYIETEFSAHMSIAAIAKKYRMAQSTLIKAYKELYNLTPSQHRKNAIIRYSIQRLTEGAELKAIAMELGYDNYSNFKRLIKREKK